LSNTPIDDHPAVEGSERSAREDRSRSHRSADATGSQSRDQSRAGDDSRWKRSSDRKPAGFGDTIERAYCAASVHVVPPSFPVQHRTGVATLRPVVVASRPGSLLICDSGHPGPHRWPDGDIAEDGRPTGEPG